MLLAHSILAGLAAPLLLALGVAPALPPVGASAPQDDAREADALRVLTVGTHLRLVFDQDVTRVAVGRSQTLSVEILNSRELLALGRAPGRTSLFVWFADGRTETLLFSVQPDLSLLRAALADIHPSIEAELAPDRPAVVLRGLVPDVSYRSAAESAAAAYLSTRDRRVLPTPLVAPGEAGETGDGESGDASVRPPEDRAEAAVINLIRLEKLPPLADERIQEALVPLAGTSVSVRRVPIGNLPNDELDVFVLEGTVPDQVTLVRVLFLASRALLGGSASDRDDLKVLADEAGALTDVTDIFGASPVGGGGNNQGGLNLGNTAGGGGQSGGRNNQILVNRIGSNLGRAKVIEAASGRILSMVTVENLPLVRVDVRLYEVNLTRLRQWRSDLDVIVSDFDQGDLLPSPTAVELQGPGAAAIGSDDVQNVLGFLGGELSNQTQYVSGGFAVDSLFNLLVNRQIARALSRPTLTVLSGELALFQVGGQVPVPVAVTLGGGTDQVLNGVEFRDFGVQLSVRPLVEELHSETITLDLSPIVSLPDLDLTAALGTAIGASPGSAAFETRGTRTHTRLRDGDAMLIGGLISQRHESGQGKTPGLGDVPLAGWLFRNEAENAEDFELVVVVNPTIVREPRSDARLWCFADPGEVLQDCLEDVRPEPEEGAEGEEEEREETVEDAPAEDSDSSELQALEQHSPRESNDRRLAQRG